MCFREYKKLDLWVTFFVVICGMSFYVERYIGIMRRKDTKMSAMISAMTSAPGGRFPWGER
ncbi:hypothetical protein GCM10011384_31080 [Psychrobacillus lasiicapitis]|nr:hypothetical protein GCM10011384_31080 [Psychrobacillus lasiicapitis]